MKSYISIFISAIFILSGCAGYDDTALRNEIDNLEDRIASLESWQAEVNANLSALSNIVNALQGNDYVTGVTDLKDQSGNLIGYSIHFAKSGSKVIYHGQNGSDGKSPEIGVRLDSDGEYYWTCNGTWLSDAYGNRIPASGSDGADGITPELKIENGLWYISYNDGADWTQLGEIQVSGSSCIFKEVKSVDGYAVFVLTDGTSYALPIRSELSISFSCEENVIIPLNSTIDIDFEIFSTTEKIDIEIITTPDLFAEIITDSSTPLKGKIRMTTGDSLSAQSKIVVLVADGNKVIMKSLRFEGEVMTISDNAIRNVGTKGGEISLELLSNVDYEVSISPEAASWITPVQTKGVTSHLLTFNVSENQGKKRSGTITIKSSNSGYALNYNIVQRGWTSVYLAEGNGIMPCSGTLYIDYEIDSLDFGINKMVDKDMNTSYKADVSEVTLIWEGDKPAQIRRVEASFTNSSSTAPQEMNFKGSHNKVTWDQIVKVTSESLYKWEYDFPSATAYKYFQITICCNKSNPFFEVKELHLLPVSDGDGGDDGNDDGNDDGTENFGFETFEDVEDRGSHYTYSSSTPMGNHYANKHVTTDEDRAWLSTATNEPNTLPSVPSYTWRNYTVNLYPFGDPVPADVNQHGIGDCSALAVFASMAYLFPDFIKSIITDNGDGTYVVDMFDPQGEPVEVALQATFLGTSSSIGAASGKDGEATWATILEKAIMKWNYIYKVNPDIHGIGSEHVAPLFTGEGNSFAFYPNVLNAGEMKRVAQLSLEESMIVIGGFNIGGLYVGTGKTVTAHAYSFMKSLNENAMFAMRNPWGYSPGTDGTEDGILNIVDDGTVPKTIDMRIIYPGAAKEYAKKPLEPYTPPTW